MSDSSTIQRGRPSAVDVGGAKGVIRNLGHVIYHTGSFHVVTSVGLNTLDSIDMVVAVDRPTRSDAEIRSNIARIMGDRDRWERSREAAREARAALRRLHRGN